MSVTIKLESRSRASGFSLIELMVTMGIVAILVAIAYPSYQNHVMRTQRSAAKACLSEHAQFMERYYTSNLTYVGAAPALGCTNESQLNTRYTFAVANLARNTYTVSATPIGVQTRDGQCGTLTITQAGVRTATGSLGAQCW